MNEEEFLHKVVWPKLGELEREVHAYRQHPNGLNATTKKLGAQHISGIIDKYLGNILLDAASNGIELSLDTHAPPAPPAGPYIQLPDELTLSPEDLIDSIRKAPAILMNSPHIEKTSVSPDFEPGGNPELWTAKQGSFKLFIYPEVGGFFWRITLDMNGIGGGKSDTIEDAKRDSIERLNEIIFGK